MIVNDNSITWLKAVLFKPLYKHTAMMEKPKMDCLLFE